MSEYQEIKERGILGSGVAGAGRGGSEKFLLASRSQARTDV